MLVNVVSVKQEGWGWVDTQNTKHTVEISDYAKFWHFKGIVYPRRIFCNYSCTLILKNKRDRTKSFKKCSCCSVPYHKSGQELGLATLKQTKIHCGHYNNNGPFDPYAFQVFLSYMKHIESLELLLLFSTVEQHLYFWVNYTFKGLLCFCSQSYVQSKRHIKMLLLDEEADADVRSLAKKRRFSLRTALSPANKQNLIRSERHHFLLQSGVSGT